MPDFKNGDVRIYYEIDGNGPEVVLVHGLAGDGGAKLEDIKNPANTPRSKEV